ncbi:sugar phosphate nucleotidyltransferase [Chelativorans composti]|jgi:Nucleoside-diphosphate-sugar pyrophosphorylase involved in lipopolysaccharide biosynthesis/translation initiation factor 2B, gamma/epsilon subunits (eIF-2Bgamma/eIF-2Bepsilon)|uniref:Nucleotidyltransferase family protein n=1 Tax=Chelativorans composti TaxID=768533 RepID=A0ABW5DFR8_9HYPH|nr:nucleotidyltransferase family protein [bacterium SGD-2]
MSTRGPEKAMVLAAGLGTRMRPITERMPKPLVPVGGKTLIDWGLDALAEAGVRKAVVNVHYLPDMLIGHLKARRTPAIAISDERDQLLDSAGGIVRALPHLGEKPFYILNADTFWIDRDGSNLARLAAAWDAEHMDMLLLLAAPAQATGHTGKLDFVMDDAGRLRRAKDAADGYIYAGAGIIHPRIFEGASAEPHSLNLYFDRAIAEGRLFGLPLEGHWLTVGTPDAIAPAEAVLERERRTS